MITSVRKDYNQQFTADAYAAYIAAAENVHPGSLEFRLAETPIFVSKDFGRQVIDACEHIVDRILSPDFKSLTDRAIPKDLNVPNENAHTHFIAFDFGICENAEGGLEPQLIEMQGFPTLFAWQPIQGELFKQYFHIPPGFNNYLGGHTEASYFQMLGDIILGGHSPEEVILLEIFPHQQKTRIDFYATEARFGVKPVCLTELIQEGKELFYLRDGLKTKIKRIYNRLIFDDLQHQQNLGPVVDLSQELEVEWATHPNWFYRISKFTLPLLQHPNIPETRFLNEISTIPANLEHYVLKPLFSFAGQGVVINVTPEAIAAVTDPENWILQKKVKYAATIATPNEPAKGELRIFYFWKDGAPRPVPVHNLGRLSKGEMVGVRYNANKDWVGGTVGFFEE